MLHPLHGEPAVVECRILARWRRRTQACTSSWPTYAPPCTTSPSPTKPPCKTHRYPYPSRPLPPPPPPPPPPGPPPRPPSPPPPLPPPPPTTSCCLHPWCHNTHVSLQCITALQHCLGGCLPFSLSRFFSPRCLCAVQQLGDVPFKQATCCNMRK